MGVERWLTLSDGFVDTGATISVTVSGDISAKMGASAGADWSFPDPWTLGMNPAFGTNNEWELAGVAFITPGNEGSVDEPYVIFQS